MDDGLQGSWRPAVLRFAAEWRALGAPRRMLLAVSGGADSIALMRLAAPLRASGAELHVATVDHGLRAESAAETRFVLEAAAQVGLTATILRWEGEKPEAGLQAAARGARYRLLAREAERWRADAILTAHSADDQAETLLMRIAHRTGARGLCGMARARFIADGAGPPQRLLRPLLDWRRTALCTHIDEKGALFINDPSNENLHFERVRIRKILGGSSRREEVIDALLSLSGCARALQRQVENIQRTRFADVSGAFHDDGSVTLSPSRLSGIIDGEIIARLLCAAGDSEHAPEDAASLALEAALAGRRSTMAGAVIDRQGSDIVIMREPSAILGRKGEAAMAPAPIAPGDRLLWDRRFIVENTTGAAAQIRPLGTAARAICLTANPEALMTAPGLWVGDALVAFPGDHGEGEKAIRSLVPERFGRLVLRH